MEFAPAPTRRPPANHRKIFAALHAHVSQTGHRDGHEQPGDVDGVRTGSGQDQQHAGDEHQTRVHHNVHAVMIGADPPQGSRS